MSDQQNENVACPCVGLDVRSSTSAPPGISRSIHTSGIWRTLHARLQELHHEGQPSDLALGRLLRRIRLIEVCVADEDERLRRRTPGDASNEERFGSGGASQSMRFGTTWRGDTLHFFPWGLLGDARIVSSVLKVLQNRLRREAVMAGW